MRSAVRTLSVALITMLLAPPAPAQEAGVRLEARYEMSLYPGDAADFRTPRGVSTDFLGNVYVADTGNHRVIHFDPEGRRVWEFGGYGWREGELSLPSDVTAREGFVLFVVDEGNDRIQQFDISDSSPNGTVFSFQQGTGLTDDELSRPHRMDVDAEGRMYVSDSLCHCVWIFSPTGAFVGRLGGLGGAQTRFSSPSGVAVGSKGNVYVADSGNRRIQVFDSIGNWKSAWGGPDETLLQQPTGIDVGPDGNVYVSDVGSGLVRVFTPRGIPLFEFGGPGVGPGSFDAPVDLAVAPDGRVYVVDEGREVVERYRIERVPEGG